MQWCHELEIAQMYECAHVDIIAAYYTGIEQEHVPRGYVVTHRINDSRRDIVLYIHDSPRFVEPYDIDREMHVGRRDIVDAVLIEDKYHPLVVPHGDDVVEACQSLFCRLRHMQTNPKAVDVYQICIKHTVQRRKTVRFVTMEEKTDNSDDYEDCNN